VRERGIKILVETPRASPFSEPVKQSDFQWLEDLDRLLAIFLAMKSENYLQKTKKLARRKTGSTPIRVPFSRFFVSRASKKAILLDDYGDTNTQRLTTSEE
jgi:hypothetical protein